MFFNPPDKSTVYFNGNVLIRGTWDGRRILEPLRKENPRRIWTLYMNDDGGYYASQGYGTVNVVGYMVEKSENPEIDNEVYEEPLC